MSKNEAIFDFDIAKKIEKLEENEQLFKKFWINEIIGKKKEWN